jgi:broad specificity polyphosphatase/5'/3'-nucleotidase SurE
LVPLLPSSGLKSRTVMVSVNVPTGTLKHYWFTVVPLERHKEGTDLWAFEHGFVSLTPLRLDLTHHEELARVIESTEGTG